MPTEAFIADVSRADLAALGEEGEGPVFEALGSGLTAGLGHLKDALIDVTAAPEGRALVTLDKVLQGRARR